MFEDCLEETLWQRGDFILLKENESFKRKSCSAGCHTHHPEEAASNAVNVLNSKIWKLKLNFKI